MLGLSLGIPFRPYDRSAIQQMLDALRRNNGSLWYVPENLSGVYVDNAGTTPVTAVGDLVGLITDKSYGGQLGVDVAPLTTAWQSLGTGISQNTSTGTLTFTATPAGQSAYRGVALTAGKTYQIEFTLASISGGGLQMFVGGGAGTAVVTAPGTYRAIVKAAAPDGPYLFTVTSAVTALVTSVTTREVPGNHAIQSAVASKPSLQRVPKRLGPNLVVNGGFDTDTGWNKGTGVSITGGSIVYTGFTVTTTPVTPVAARVGATYQIRVSGVSLVSGAISCTFGGTATSLYTNRAVEVTATSAAAMALSSAALEGSIGELAISEVLEWTNVISFDGSNDFLTTGITTGNEGWVCAGVTPANTTAAMSVANAGEGTSTIPGVWLFSSSGNWYASAADGSLRTQQAIPMPSTAPQVLGLGWNASGLSLSVNNTELTTPKIGTGSWSSGANVLRFGLYQGSSTPFNGSMHAIAYTPVLPSAADRATIRNGIATLQGRVL